MKTDLWKLEILGGTKTLMMKKNKVNILLFFSCYDFYECYKCWIAANVLLPIFTLLLYFYGIIIFMIRWTKQSFVQPIEIWVEETCGMIPY